MGAFLVACNPKPQQNSSAGMETESTAAVKDGIFIHITQSYNDPHRVLMPLKMATLMAEDKDVLIYMDIHAVELLVKDAEDLTYEGFDSLETYLDQLLGMGVEIYACPTCLKVAGFETGDLKKGIKPADKNRFFSFTEGRILTIDY